MDEPHIRHTFLDNAAREFKPQGQEQVAKLTENWYVRFRVNK